MSSRNAVDGHHCVHDLSMLFTRWRHFFFDIFMWKYKVIFLCLHNFPSPNSFIKCFAKSLVPFLLKITRTKTNFSLTSIESLFQFRHVHFWTIDFSWWLLLLLIFHFESRNMCFFSSQQWITLSWCVFNRSGCLRLPPIQLRFQPWWFSWWFKILSNYSELWNMKMKRLKQKNINFSPVRIISFFVLRVFFRSGNKRVFCKFLLTIITTYYKLRTINRILRWSPSQFYRTHWLTINIPVNDLK